MNFSLEIGPKTEIDKVPALSDIYITMLPGGDYRETADKAVELVKKGFNPVPHFPARSMHDEKELKDYVSRCKDGGVKQALIIGGGREPVGKFDSSFQLLETGYFEKMKIGIAGYGYVGQAHELVLKNYHNIIISDPAKKHYGNLRHCDAVIVCVSTPQRQYKQKVLL